MLEDPKGRVSTLRLFERRRRGHARQERRTNSVQRAEAVVSFSCDRIERNILARRAVEPAPLARRALLRAAPCRGGRCERRRSRGSGRPGRGCAREQQRSRGRRPRGGVAASRLESWKCCRKCLKRLKSAPEKGAPSQTGPERQERAPGGLRSPRRPSPRIAFPGLQSDRFWVIGANFRAEGGSQASESMIQAGDVR